MTVRQCAGGSPQSRLAPCPGRARTGSLSWESCPGRARPLLDRLPSARWVVCATPSLLSSRTVVRLSDAFAADLCPSTRRIDKLQAEFEGHISKPQHLGPERPLLCNMLHADLPIFGDGAQEIWHGPCAGSKKSELVLLEGRCGDREQAAGRAQRRRAGQNCMCGNGSCMRRDPALWSECGGRTGTTLDLRPNSCLVALKALRPDAPQQRA